MKQTRFWPVLGITTAVVVTVAGCGPTDQSGGISTDIIRNAPSGTSNVLRDQMNRTANTPSPTAPNQSTLIGGPTRPRPANSTNPVVPDQTRPPDTGTPVRPPGHSPSVSSVPGGTAPGRGTGVAGTGGTRVGASGGTSVQSGATNGTGPANAVTAAPARPRPMMWETQSQSLGPNLTVSLSIPLNWTRYRATVGNTGGFEWINPANSRERIAVLTTTNIAMLQNRQGYWDVTKLFGTSTGIHWTTISADGQSGHFIDTNPYGAPSAASSTSQQPDTGMGFAQIQANLANPTAVVVEFWGPKNIGETAMESLSIQ